MTYSTLNIASFYQRQIFKGEAEKFITVLQVLFNESNFYKERIEIFPNYETIKVIGRIKSEKISFRTIKIQILASAIDNKIIFYGNSVASPATIKLHSRKFDFNCELTIGIYGRIHSSC